MSWLILLIAGFLEVIWAIGLKYTDGFTKFWPSVATITAMISSFVLLGIAMKTLPMGVAYSVWVGIGAVGAVLMGVLLFSESVSLLKFISVSLIVLGIIGLKISSTP